MPAFVAILGAALGSGCLLPQEDSKLQNYTQPNRPPRIVENWIEPPRQTTVGTRSLSTDGGVAACKVEFAAFVEDPDIDDAVTWRWYIDYDPEKPERNRPMLEGQLAPTGKPLRGSVRFPVPIQDNPDFREGVRVVTVMVFDGHLGTFDGPGSVPPPEPVPGTDGGLVHYSTTFDWVVTVDPNEECPS
jgi:hypothetical protein